MKTLTSKPFVVSGIDFQVPQRLSAFKLLSHLRDPSNWPEASIHRATDQYPFVNIEFHCHVGFSVLCFDKPRSVGHLAATASSLSEPRVLVCLDGQVIERWPEELFLSGTATKDVISHFLNTGKRSPTI
jgi:hypothetical protein